MRPNTTSTPLFGQDIIDALLSEQGYERNGQRYRISTDPLDGTFQVQVWCSYLWMGIDDRNVSGYAHTYKRLNSAFKRLKRRFDLGY